MKKTLFLLFAILAISIHAQQSKQVYITLDVSGSMTGDKYALANYTTQMIVTLCDENDDVWMIVQDKETNLSKQKKPLKQLQHPMNTLPIAGTNYTSQFDDIIYFNKIYKPSNKKQNWLFIIGDGWWSTESYPKKDRNNFKKHVEEGNLNVCYLQTGENLTEQSDFTKYAEKLGVIDIGKSSIDPKTIRKGCDHFAKKILGFSEVDMSVSSSGSNSLVFTTELPITGFIIVYQDNVKPDQLPNITEVSSNGNNLNCQLKGTPTTENLYDPTYNSQNPKILLSGNVWRVKTNSTIEANSTVEVQFDKSIDLKNVNIYPIVKNINSGSFAVSPVGSYRNIDGKTIAVCQNEKKAQISITLNEEAHKVVPDSTLAKSTVTVKANNKSYPAKYKNGIFECDIDLNENETPYFAEIDCPGYFHVTTPVQKIIKDKNCKPEKMERETLPPLEYGQVLFDSLHTLSFTIVDKESMAVLDPNNFELTVETENGFMFEDPTVRIEGDAVHVDIRPKGAWCECLFPGDLTINVVSTPKQGASFEEGKQYKQTAIPLHVTIVKHRPWLSRCMWVLIALGILIVNAIYLNSMLKKKRFKKHASIKSAYYDRNGELIEQNGEYLRKKGLGPWFCRWFLPMDEKRDYTSNRPRAVITFYATESKNTVKFPVANFERERMSVDGYDPDINTKDKFVKVHDNGPIDIANHNGTKDGRLTFSAGKENDEGGYKLIFGILFFATLAAIAALLFFTIKALF